MTSRKQNGGTLLGIFIGLLIGVLLSFGVVWYMNKSPLPFRDKASRAGETEAPATPVPLPGKPGDKPRFEFYKILPGSQETATTPAPNPAPESGKAEAEKPPVDTLYLQAVAFQNASDADNLKAKLALMGVDASVQEVDLADKGRMHRVRIGPLSGLDELNRVRALLSQNGIQTAPARGK